MKYNIPKSIRVGGQDIEVKIVETIPGQNCGISDTVIGEIQIAKYIDNRKQSESSMYNTFIHECLHAILGTMGEYELNENEKFVSCMSGFVMEIIRSIDVTQSQEHSNTSTNTSMGETMSEPISKPISISIDETMNDQPTQGAFRVVSTELWDTKLCDQNINLKL